MDETKREELEKAYRKEKDSRLVVSVSHTCGFEKFSEFESRRNRYTVDRHATAEPVARNLPIRFPGNWCKLGA